MENTITVTEALYGWTVSASGQPVKTFADRVTAERYAAIWRDNPQYLALAMAER